MQIRKLNGYKRVIREKDAKKDKILNNSSTEIAQLLISYKVRNLWLAMLLVSKIVEQSTNLNTKSLAWNVIGFKDCRIVDDFEYERYFQNVTKTYSEISNIRAYWKILVMKEVMKVDNIQLL